MFNKTCQRAILWHDQTYVFSCHLISSIYQVCGLLTNMCGDPVMFQQVLGIYTCRGLAPALHQLCLSPARMPTRGRYSTRGVDTGAAMDGHLQEPRENRPPPSHHGASHPSQSCACPRFPRCSKGPEEKSLAPSAFALLRQWLRQSADCLQGGFWCWGCTVHCLIDEEDALTYSLGSIMI